MKKFTGYINYGVLAAEKKTGLDGKRSPCHCYLQ